MSVLCGDTCRERDRSFRVKVPSAEMMKALSGGRHQSRAKFSMHSWGNYIVERYKYAREKRQTADTGPIPGPGRVPVSSAQVPASYGRTESKMGGPAPAIPVGACRARFARLSGSDRWPVGRADAA